MTTNLKKSFFPLALLMTGAVCLSLFIASCGGPKGDGVWIPNPVDTSELGIRDHFIPQDSITAYRKRYDEIRDTLKIKMPSLYIPFSEAYNKRSLLELMKDPTCVGIRVYYGATAVKKDGTQDLRLILVGVDKLGKDVFVKKFSSADGKVGDDPPSGGFEYGQCAPPCYDEGK